MINADIVIVMLTLLLVLQVSCTTNNVETSFAIYYVLDKYIHTLYTIMVTSISKESLFILWYHLLTTQFVNIQLLLSTAFSCACHAVEASNLSFSQHKLKKHFNCQSTIDSFVIDNSKCHAGCTCAFKLSTYL